MGYRGKQREQEQARRLHAQNKTLQEIADALARVQVVRLPLGPRRPLHPQQAPLRPAAPPSPGTRAQAPADRGVQRGGEAATGSLERETFFVAGAALYAGEGSKTRRSGPLREQRRRDDALLLRVAPDVLRHRRVAPARARLSARGARSRRCGAASGRASPDVPRSQFGKPYRAVADPSIRRNKHEFGCCYVDLLVLANAPRGDGIGSRLAIVGAAIPGWRNRWRRGLLIRRLRVRAPPPELELTPPARARPFRVTRSPRGRSPAALAAPSTWRTMPDVNSGEFAPRRVARSRGRDPSP